MKKIVLLVAFCVLGLTVLLCGCAHETSTDSFTTLQSTSEIQMNHITTLPPRIETPYYILENSNGEMYLTFFNESEITPPSDSDEWETGLIAVPMLNFSSLAEMRQKFITGDWSETELRELKRFTHDPVTNVIKLYNLNAIVEPKLSSRATVKVYLTNGNKLWFSILNMSFSDTDQEKYSFKFTVSSKEACEELIQKEFDNKLNDEWFTVTSHKKIEERDAEEIFYVTKFSVENRKIRYSFEKGDTVYTVIESYLLRNSGYPEYESAERPQYTYVFLQNKNGACGYYYLSNALKDIPRLTIDEISSIGIGYYTGEDIAVK